MAASVLGSGEKVVLSSFVKKCFENDRDIGRAGTLIWTDSGRLVFVAEQGRLNKKYDVLHYYGTPSITNVRVEKRLVGNALAIDVDWQEPKGQYTYRYEGIDQPELWVSELKGIGHFRDARAEVLRVLKSKERTKLSEMQSIFQKAGIQDASVENVVTLLRGAISRREIDGFVDEEKQEFVYVAADQQEKEVGRHDIAAGVTLGSSGNLEVICPHCGNSQELAEKKTMATCKYCDKNYMIPEKILSLL